jgi:hypothetical protein
MSVTALESTAGVTITTRDSCVGTVTGPDSCAVATINTRFARHHRRQPTPWTDEQRQEEAREQSAWSAGNAAYAAETRARAKLASLAHRTGEVCGHCGARLLVSDPAWLVRVLFGSVRRLALLCRTCAPPGLPTPWTCATCHRPVGARRRPRGRVCCSKACRWRWYNAQRKVRAAAERQKVCLACGRSFQAGRRDARTCRPACRQRWARQRRRQRERVLGRRGAFLSAITLGFDS